MRKKTHLEIVAEILDFCRKPQYKSNIMAHSNLSWRIFKKYLSMLESNGFLQARDNPVKYATTSKGRMFTRKWNEIVRLLESERK